MTWWTATSVSVTNGQKIVSVTTGDDVQIAQEAGGLVIGNQPPVEIKRTFLDGGGAKKIELRLPWPYANQTNQPAVAFPTDADLAEATRILREIAADFDMQPTASSVAVRTSDGRLKATNATESNDAVVLGQLGTAAFANRTISQNDITQGRLLKVGDFGIGGDFYNIVDFNSVKYTSFEGANVGANIPINSIGVRKTYAYSSDWVAQEFVAISPSPTEFIRNFYSGSTWSPWYFRYTNSNVVGTVSQSGGTPTGAIIQRGSNANGSFVMFADGTAMYWGSRNVTGVSINAATPPNHVTSFDCPDPNVLSLTGKMYVVTGASAFDSSGQVVYIVRGQNSSVATYLSLGTRPSDQWPYLNSFGPHVITSYFYEFFCIGRWF